MSECPIIMGILNVTPDSFSDGAPDASAADFVRKAESLITDGADILDIGGESTRPGASPVSAAEEIARVVPVLKLLRANYPEFPISLDTTKLEVARAAAPFGIAILNDVSCLSDLRLVQFAKASGWTYILMHSRGTPATMLELTDYPDGVLSGLFGELCEKLKALHDIGFPAEKIWLDPGFGFAKTPEQCHEMAESLNAWELFRDENCPKAKLMIGVSRKRFLKQYVGETKADARDAVSVKIAQEAVKQGFTIVRTHNVALTKAAFRL